MRILEVEVYGRGGLAHYVNNLSQALALRGHRVWLVTAADYELAERTTLPSNLEIVKRTGRHSRKSDHANTGILHRTWRRIEALFDAFAVTRLARRLDPDVIHFHSTNSIAFVYLSLFRRLRAPVVYTAHVVTPHEPMRMEKAIWGSIHRSVDLVVAHSRFDRARLQEEFGLPPSRVEVIPHGEYSFFEQSDSSVSRQDARQSLGLGPSDEVALFFGYIREYKGLDLLFEAWPEVVAARPNSRLLVAGDPVQLSQERLAELRAWAERVGAAHRFAYIPFSDVGRYFRAADTLVLPYRRISQSGVLYLALSLGVPVVATRVGGLPEMLQEGVNALLVPPGDVPELAQALIRILGDPALRSRLADGGHRLADEHSWESIAKKTEAAFGRIGALSG